MPKMILKCDNCGIEYESYQCGKYHHFCSIECRRKAGKLVASSFDEDTRRRASERITYYNKNVFNKGEYKERNSEAKRQKGSRKGYTKINGRHKHRIIAEQMLGRKLQPGEIVHHKDGDKRNNTPENLEVMTQSEHIREHLRRGGGRLAHII
jgi:hypothetical protein